MTTDQPTMRLRLLELPSVVTGDDVRTPFIWVLDNVGEVSMERLAEFRDSLASFGGAVDAAVFSEEVTLE